MLLLKILFSITCAACFFYAACVLFPKKLKLASKYGNQMTNGDFIALVKSNAAAHPDIVELIKKTRLLLWVAIPSSLSLLFIVRFTGS